MKSKFNLLILAFLFGLYLNGNGAEKTKEFNESWPVGSVESLTIVNKYGDIEINNNGGPDVTIDVVVTVEASTEGRANSLLELFKINFSNSGGRVKAVTEIDNNFKNIKGFSVDYTVNIPSDKSLDISNKFGNTVVNELNAAGNFHIEYGALTASSLNNPDGKINLNLSYSKVSSIESLSDANISMDYSTLNIDEAGELEVESKYSVLSVEETPKVKIQSKYDTFNFEEVGSITAYCKYSHFKIEELKTSLKVESGFGSIKVDEVSSSFELIDIDNNYGSIKLGIGDNVSYDLKANCQYCGVDYNEDDFKGNRMKENANLEIDGKVGSGPSTAKVIIKSRYGGVKLY